MNTSTNKRTLTVLVIDQNSKQGTPLNWSKNFEKARERRFSLLEKREKGEEISALEFYNNNGFADEKFFRLFQEFDVVVEQANWNDVQLTSYLDSAKGKRACFSILASSKPVADSQKKNRRVIPQLVLIRTLPYALTHVWDHRNILLGIIHAGIPCVNSARAIWINELERPFMFAGLKAIQDRLGKEEFPLINQYYYSAFSEMGFVPGPYPHVVKVAHVDAGMGKMKVNTEEEMTDLRTVVGIHGDYATCEPFLEGAYDLRIQKIGQRIRAFKRTGMSWKTNMDSLAIEEIELHPRYVKWINEARVEMDICTVDALVSAKDGSEHILEVNGCGSGVPYLTEDQDYIAMVDLCLSKLFDNYAVTHADPEKIQEDKKGEDTQTSLAQLQNVVEELQATVTELQSREDDIHHALKKFDARLEAIRDQFRRKTKRNLILFGVLLATSAIMGRYYLGNQSQ